VWSEGGRRRALDQGQQQVRVGAAEMTKHWFDQGERPACRVGHNRIYRVGQNHTFKGIYGEHTVFLAGESPYIRSYMVCIYVYDRDVGDFPADNSVYVSYTKACV